MYKNLIRYVYSVKELCKVYFLGNYEEQTGAHTREERVMMV